MERRHRRHRQARSGEGKAYMRPCLKPKLTAHVELVEVYSDGENSTASDAKDTLEELGGSDCSTPVSLSPALDVEAETWPSLREAANDFDFCSELSETPSLVSEVSINTVNTNSSWVALGSKKSYAGLLAGYAGEQKPQQWPSLKKNLPVATKEVGFPETVEVALPEGPEVEPDNNSDLRQKGWQKNHKTSKNEAFQRKVAYQASRRAEQRQQGKNARAALCLED